MSFWQIQEGRGSEGGRERKRKLSDKSLCIFLQSYTNFRKAGLNGGPADADAVRRRPGGRVGGGAVDGPQSGCSRAQLMTTSNIPSL